MRADALQLHPIIVTFAFLLGAQLAGAIGAIVAIPLAAVVHAFTMQYFERYRTQRPFTAGFLYQLVDIRNLSQSE